jgi:hypothetical protein
MMASGLVTMEKVKVIQYGRPADKKDFGAGFRCGLHSCVDLEDAWIRSPKAGESF